MSDLQVLQSGASDRSENVKSLNSLEVIKMRLTRSKWSLGGPLGTRGGFVGRSWADVESVEEFH